MNLDNLLVKQDQLQRSAKKMLDNNPVFSLLSKIGTPIVTGSYTNGLMVYPDIDIAVQNKNPNFQKATQLVPNIFKQLNAKEVKITDFSNSSSSASFYIGINFYYEKELWRIDATVTQPGLIKV